MKVLLWVLQVSLALHTVTGAMWKLSNGAASVGSLSAIPEGAWLALAALEVVAALGLVLPAFGKRFASAAPLAAGFVAVEMLGFCAVALLSGTASAGELAYWLVVAALCGSVAIARLRPAPTG